MAKEETLNVRIVSPKKLLWEGKAVAVAGHNSLGDFSILPEHANYVSLIDQAVTVFISKKEQRKIPLSHGLIFCRENTIQVFTDLPLGRERKRLWQRLMASPDSSV